MSKINKGRLSAILTLILVMAMSASISVFADSDAGAANYTVTANSREELDDYLSPGSNYSYVKLGQTTWSFSNLEIPAGTTLDLNGQTVQSSGKYAFLLAGDRSSVTNGTIKGGGVKVNSSDPSGYISKLKIINAAEHAIWIYGGTIGSITDNVITTPLRIGICINKGNVKGNISGNTLAGCKDTSAGSIYLNSGATVSGKISGNTISDGKNIGLYMYSKSSCGAIENNKITGCTSHAIRLVGSSSAKTNDGSTAGDIAYNTISGCKGHGISLYNGSHCGKITHNDLKNLGGNTATGDFAIIVNAGSSFRTYASEVTYNTIDGVATAGIVAFSGPEGQSTTKYQDFGYIKGDIAYNTISNNATAKRNVNWKKQKKSDPPCEGAIYVDCHARVFGNIHDNVINTSYDDGINVLAWSQVKSIYNNTVNNASNAGIAVKNNSKVKAIYNNKINKPKRYGIFINSGSKVTGKVYKNTISKSAESGLVVLSKSSVRVFTKNTITDAGLYGVIVGGGGSIVNTLSSNSISIKNKKEGYPVFCNSKSKIVKITGNTLGGIYLAGIRVKQPSGKVTVSSNVLKCRTPKGVKTAGISADGCKKGITIVSNKIYGNSSGPGIFVKSSKSNIKKNKIKKVTKKIVRS